MQAISPQEVMANSPRLRARLTMVGLDVLGISADSNLRELLWERLICSGLSPIRFFVHSSFEGFLGFERAAANSTQTAEELAGAAQAG